MKPRYFQFGRRKKSDYSFGNDANFIGHELLESIALPLPW